MVLESQNEYDSQWAALSSIAPETVCTAPGFVSMNGIPVAVMAN